MYGFSAINDTNITLLDTEVQNLHFQGKPYYKGEVVNNLLTVFPEGVDNGPMITKIYEVWTTSYCINSPYCGTVYEAYCRTTIQTKSKYSYYSGDGTSYAIDNPGIVDMFLYIPYASSSVDVPNGLPYEKSSYSLYMNTNYSERLEGRRIYKFGIVISNDEVPVIFIKPIGNTNYSIIKLFKVGYREWEIWVLQKGIAPNVPTLYAFASADGLYSNDAYGMQLINSNGKVTFDSRFKPLSIIGAGYVGVPPSTLHPGFYTKDIFQEGKTYFDDRRLDYNFNFNTPSYSDVKTNTATSMFYAASNAQTCNQHSKGGYYYSQGVLTDAQYHEARSTWWVMHMLTFGIENGTYFSKWGIYSAGVRRYVEIENDNGFLGLGGGDDYAITTGSAPYINKTINTEPTFIMIADSSLYD